MADFPGPVTFFSSNSSTSSMSKVFRSLRKSLTGKPLEEDIEGVVADVSPRASTNALVKAESVKDQADDSNGERRVARASTEKLPHKVRSNRSSDAPRKSSSSKSKAKNSSIDASSKKTKKSSSSSKSSKSVRLCV